ncbi:MAG: hypothetical protein IH585_20265 [Anaerolineaceae bacterium]|nr:hypothetical protein [Anaerolineaceae bacterium]
MKKYWEDSYVFSFEGKIQEVIHEPDRVGVVLEGTYFYPEGGGQPSDKGTIASFMVIDIQEIGETIVHYIDLTKETETFFTPGSHVHCEIDRDYRINNMRIHTTCHILFGAAKKLFGEVGYAGFNIGDVGNLYLETPRQIRSDDLQKMAALANEIVVEDRPVTSFFVDHDKAKQMKELAYNIELSKGQVRIIEVAGWDIAACSGTHMCRTVELGPIKVIAREIHKKNVTRIDYAVGKRAVEEMTKDEKSLSETAELLSTSKYSTPHIVRKLVSDFQTVQKDLRKMRERIMDYRIKELQAAGGEIYNGICLITDAVDYLDDNGIKVMASKLLHGVTGTVVAIVGGNDMLSIAAGCSSDLNLMVSQPIVAIAKKYDGGGGGKPTFVTAGGIHCDLPSLLAEVKVQLIKVILS